MWYVTKYTLTAGIIEIPQECGELFEGYLSIKRGCYKGGFFGAKDYFDNLPDAQARAANIVEAKIRSVEKQMKKLQAMANNPIKVVRKDP